jgi:hypothetical protein
MKGKELLERCIRIILNYILDNKVLEEWIGFIWLGIRTGLVDTAMNRRVP